ncbi:MAG: hypothetical protein RLZZ469_381 [Bacteroidota bacterium]|jgi:hypothetical protein
MTRNKLYVLLGVACFLGFVYLFFSTYYLQQSDTTLCWFKNVTGYNCPSCGTTRAVLSLFKANLLQSVQFNPLGLIVLLIMIIAPVWIAVDLLTRQDTLFQKYKQTEVFLRKPLVASFFIVMILLLWYWTLTKNL